MYGVSAQALRSRSVDEFVGECAAFCAGRREWIHMTRTADEDVSDRRLLKNAGHTLVDVIETSGTGGCLRAVRAYTAVANLMTYGRRRYPCPLPAGVLDACRRVVNEALANADTSMAAAPTPQDVAALVLMAVRYQSHYQPAQWGARVVLQEMAIDALCGTLGAAAAAAADSGDVSTLVSASYVLLRCAEVADKAARYAATKATVAAALEKALLVAGGGGGAAIRTDFSAPTPSCVASLSADEHQYMLSCLLSDTKKLLRGGFVPVVAAKAYFSGFAEVVDVRGAALPTKLVTEFVSVLAKISSPDAGLPMARYLSSVLAFFDRVPAATAEAMARRQNWALSKHHAMRVRPEGIDQVVHNLATLVERWRRDRGCAALCGRVHELMLDLAGHAKPEHYPAALRLACACSFVGADASFLQFADIVLRTRSVDAQCVAHCLRSQGQHVRDPHELFVEHLQRSIAAVEESRGTGSIDPSVDLEVYKGLLDVLKKASDDASGSGSHSRIGTRTGGGGGGGSAGSIPILPSPFPKTLHGVVRVIADGFVFSRAPGCLIFHKDNAEAVLGHVAAICAEETAHGRGDDLPRSLSDVVNHLTRRRLDYPSLDPRRLASFVELLAETAERRMAAVTTDGRTLLVPLTTTTGFVAAVQGTHPVPVPGLAEVELRVLRMLHAVVGAACAAPPAEATGGTAATRRLVGAAAVAVARLTITARTRRPGSEGGGFSCAAEEAVHEVLATQLVPRAVGGLLRCEGSVVFAAHQRTENVLRVLATDAAGYLQSGLTFTPALRRLFDDFVVTALLHTSDPLIVFALVPLMCGPQSVYTGECLSAEAKSGLLRCAAMLTTEIETNAGLSLSRVMTTARQLALSIPRPRLKVLSSVIHAALSRVAQAPPREMSDQVTREMVHTLSAQMLPAESRLMFSAVYPKLVAIAKRKELAPSTAASFVRFLEQAALTVDDDPDNLLGLLAEILVGSADVPPPPPDRRVLYPQVISGFVSAGLAHPELYDRLEAMCLANMRQGIGVRQLDAARAHIVEAYASLALTTSSLPGVCGNPLQTSSDDSGKEATKNIVTHL